jgi:site-specific recombinase XerD
METIEKYRRSLKRRNFSAHTVKNYMHRLAHFLLWLPVPLNTMTRREMGAYVDHLLEKKLSPRSPAICRRYASSSSTSLTKRG